MIETRVLKRLCLVIMHAVSSLVRCIPCKSRSNVLETIIAWAATPKAIKCDNAQEVIHERKFKAWRQANQVALVRVQAPMETRVPSSDEEGNSPIVIAKPTNVHCHPEKLLHPPGCLVHVTAPKDHPEVKDSSLGARALEGIFFGNDPNSPLVRAYIPRLNRIVSANEVILVRFSFLFQQDASRRKN
jgi:hypothetical protein